MLQDLVPERPDPDGHLVPCDCIENATLLCTVDHDGRRFPLSLAVKRIDPGQKNTWELRVVGMAGGVAFPLAVPKTLWIMQLDASEQVWQQVDMGSQGGFATVTGSLLEFGFSDSILQMWAAFLAERAGALGDRFGCVTPQEALASHRIFAAALRSDAEGAVVAPGQA